MTNLKGIVWRQWWLIIWELMMLYVTDVKPDEVHLTTAHLIWDPSEIHLECSTGKTKLYGFLMTWGAIYYTIFFFFWGGVNYWLIVFISVTTQFALHGWFVALGRVEIRNVEIKSVSVVQTEHRRFSGPTGDRQEPYNNTRGTHSYSWTLDYQRQVIFCTCSYIPMTNHANRIHCFSN